MHVSVEFYGFTKHFLLMHHVKTRRHFIFLSIYNEFLRQCRDIEFKNYLQSIEELISYVNHCRTMVFVTIHRFDGDNKDLKISSYRLTDWLTNSLTYCKKKYYNIVKKFFAIVTLVSLIQFITENLIKKWKRLLIANN